MSEPARRGHDRGVLDTSTVMLLPRLEDPALLPAEPLITTITLAELSVGPLVASTGHERAARQAHLQQAGVCYRNRRADPFSARRVRPRFEGRIDVRFNRRQRPDTSYRGALRETDGLGG